MILMLTVMTDFIFLIIQISAPMLINIGAERNSSHEFAHKLYTLKHKRCTGHAVEALLSSGVSIDVAVPLGV